MVEGDPEGSAQAPSSPRARERQVEVRGQHVGELEQGERGLVREHASSLGPEPDLDELLVLVRGEVDESVDPAPGTDKSPAPQVMPEELGRVADLRGLLGGEQPSLGGGELVEAIPVGPGGQA